MKKLEFYGVEGKGLDLMSSYLKNRIQILELDGIQSAPLPISTGVPQGSILGPLLFVIYINDLVLANKNLNSIMYADDTTLSTILNPIKNSELSSLKINNALQDVSHWLKANKLSLNVKKTKFMIFHHPNKQYVSPILKINDTIIERVKSFNFLGLTIDENLTWKAHLNKVVTKLSKACGALNRLKHFLPTDIKKMIYNALILPHLNYNVMIWGHKLNKITNIQKRALRYIVNASYSAHTEPILKLLNMLKLEDIYKLSKLKFYYKYSKKMLPQFFQNISFTKIEEGHDIDLRNKADIRLPFVKSGLTNISIKYMIADFINTAPAIILEMMGKICYQSFKDHVKKVIIESYSETCVLLHCYTCNR